MCIEDEQSSAAGGEARRALGRIFRAGLKAELGLKIEIAATYTKTRYDGYLTANTRNESFCAVATDCSARGGACYFFFKSVSAYALAPGNSVPQAHATFAGALPSKLLFVSLLLLGPHCPLRVS